MPSLLSRLDGGALDLKLAPGVFFGPVSPDWSIESRFFSDHDFFYCLDGEAEFRCGKETALLSPGRACLVRGGQTLSARHTSKGRFRVFAQHFDLRLWGREDLISLLDFSFDAALPHREWYEVWTQRMAEMSQAGNRGVQRQALFLPMLLDFLGAAWVADRTVSPETRVLQAVEEALREGFHRDDALKRALSKAAWDSPYTSRLFARRYGATPKQYLIRLRLERARELLESGMPVKEVAHACGFTDELYFSRLFRKKDGRPPTAHRSLW
ncbi:MAG: helix-turn-helix domain-containing protein [Spirochaetes bacterium]|nr:helix-turn-helix domain-containing protein [Spirochaetota bacterium]